MVSVGPLFEIESSSLLLSSKVFNVLNDELRRAQASRVKGTKAPCSLHNPTPYMYCSLRACPRVTQGPHRVAWRRRVGRGDVGVGPLVPRPGPQQYGVTTFTHMYSTALYLAAVRFDFTVTFRTALRYAVTR